MTAVDDLPPAKRTAGPTLRFSEVQSPHKHPRAAKSWRTPRSPGAR